MDSISETHHSFAGDYLPYFKRKSMELPIIIHIRQNDLEDASLLVLAETRLTPLLLCPMPSSGCDLLDSAFGLCNN
jgi:hypothetical protein